MSQFASASCDTGRVVRKPGRRTRLRFAMVITASACGAAISGLAACSSTPGSAPTTAQAAPPAPLTAEQVQLNVQSFDQVWEIIRDRHWDATLGGLDWNAVRAELRPKVEQATTMAEARHVMQEMIHRLKQSHFGIIPAEAYAHVSKGERQDGGGHAAPAAPGAGNAAAPDAGPKGESGIEFRVLKGEAIVFRVDPGTAAATAGVQPGWRLVSVDGTATADVIAQVSSSFQGESLRDLMLDRALSGMLTGEVGDQHQAVFDSGTSKAMALTLTLREPAGVASKFGNLPEMYVQQEARVISAPGAPKIGYYRLSVFFDPPGVMAKFSEAMNGWMDANGVIIDLRGNPGGIGLMANSMSGWFVDQKDLKLGTMKTRDATVHFSINPRAKTYAGPVAILVDGGSVSTSEIMAGGLKDIGRARIFGSKTPGAALPSAVVKLPNGDGFQYAFANYVSAAGAALEANGVTPDEPTELTREQLLQGRDTVIDAAVSWIASSQGQAAH